MAARKTAGSKQATSVKSSNEIVEQKLVAFAEQLGWLLGTVRARADDWLDPERLRKEVGRIRDGAADLLTQVNRASAAARKAATKKAVATKAAKAPRPSRGLVDAPGKRHRKPPTQERINPRMGEPEGKHVGQKSLKNGMRRGRG